MNVETVGMTIRNRSFLFHFLLVFFFSIEIEAQTIKEAYKGITAHRGNSGDYPENTIPAFKSGIALNVDWVELDIHQTKDGKLVVLHDATTKRVGDKDLTVAQATYEELMTVDVATDFRRRMGKSLSDCPVERIPLLEDVLRVVLTQNKTRVSIQPKVDCVREAVKLVKKMGAEKMVGFNDGNLQFMSKVKELAQEISVFWDRGPKTDLDEDIRIAKMKGFEALVIHYSAVTEEKIEKIKKAGLEVGSWTVNVPYDMKRLRKMGVERIYTNHPETLISIDRSK